MTIRPYRVEDCPRLVALFRQSVRQVGALHYSPEQVLAWAPDEIDIGHFGARRASRPTWVAEKAGQIVGFADLEADGQIDMLYVHPEYQRQGIAQTLLGAVEANAIERGMRRLYAQASLGARPFFERQEFLAVSEQTVRRNGQLFVNYRMEKALPHPGKAEAASSLADQGAAVS
jgi:putative acetyltransferase